MTDLLRLCGPLILWLASFSTIFSLQRMFCALGWGTTPVVLARAVAIAVQASVLADLYATRLRIRHGVARWASLNLGAIGLDRGDLDPVPVGAAAGLILGLGGRVSKPQTSKHHPPSVLLRRGPTGALM